MIVETTDTAQEGNETKGKSATEDEQKIVEKTVKSFSRLIFLKHHFF
jgi:hypothetical protein